MIDLSLSKIFAQNLLCGLLLMLGTCSMMKVFGSEVLDYVADEGVQIYGGMGYSAETDMQRYWRDSRLLRIGPVSNEMARNMIAESYGLPRSF